MNAPQDPQMNWRQCGIGTSCRLNLGHDGPHAFVPPRQDERGLRTALVLAHSMLHSGEQPTRQSEDIIHAALLASPAPDPGAGLDAAWNGERRCIFAGCVATWRHWHGFLPGGYDNPADPEGVPIIFEGDDPEPNAVRDFNGAALAPPGAGA